MSGTVLKHPLVRIYLRDLSAACVTLPIAQARELREQIEAHLDEALTPDSDDAAVRTELARLGSPRALAAEVAGPVPPPARTRLRNRLSRLRWWTWATIALTVAVLGTVIGYPIVVSTVAPLADGGMATWYFPQDRNRIKASYLDGVSELKVPERVYQRQGFVISIYNDTDWTQTILGLDPGHLIESLEAMSVAMGTGPGVAYPDDWDFEKPTRWITPAVIPPHSYRVLRVLWTSNMCNEPGSSLVLTNLWLRVRVGLITRTENVQLSTNWAVAGTKASKCSGGHTSPPTPPSAVPSPSRGGKR